MCSSMKRKKSTNNASDIDSDLITVNNFFACFVKEISVTKYGSDKELTPTFSPHEIFQYSDSMLKHLPKDALKKIGKEIVYSKEPVYFNMTTIDRRIHDGSDFTITGLSNMQIATAKANTAKDLNLVDTISKFQNQLKDSMFIEFH